MPPASLSPLISEAGARIDAFAAAADPMLMHGVAAEEGSTRGVPRAMWDGPVDDEGWVRWKVLPSDLTAADLAALEKRFDVRFPPIWAAYLRARCHCFDQLKSERHGGRLVGLPDAPAGRALEAQTSLLKVNTPLERAGFVPIAGWGDGWGPVCFDATRRGVGGDCPVVWLDHEPLAGLSRAGRLGDRAAVEPLAQPLYGCVRDLLKDLFAAPNGAGSGVE